MKYTLVIDPEGNIMFEIYETEEKANERMLELYEKGVESFVEWTT